MNRVRCFASRRAPLGALTPVAVIIMAALAAFGAAVTPAAGFSGASSAASPRQENRPAPAPAQNTDENDEDDAPPQRVYVQVNRHEAVAGTVELEDDEVIAVRDRRGELHTYTKSRLTGIVRLVDPQARQAGVTYMRDGQRRAGVIIEDHFEYVLMEIEGIRAKLPRQAVSHVVLEPTVDEQYETAKAMLQPGNINGWLELCRWLVREKAWNLAKQELDELLQQEESGEARRLLRIVDAQLSLETGEEGDGDVHSRRTGGRDDPNTGRVNVRDMLPDQLLTQEEVNLIRVYEIDFEKPPKVALSQEVIRELIARYGTHAAMPASQTDRMSLFRADPLEVVRLMFEMKARDMYPDIQVVTEPNSMNLFRIRVHDTWLINNCATSRCHGGPNGGRFFLHNRNWREERVRYTNFLILERLKLDPDWPLINYDQPLMSLIVQYAMPRTLAKLQHPDVDGWKPVFTRGSTKMIEGVLEWIDAMMQPRPSYPVDFIPPMLGQAKPPTPTAGGSGAPAGTGGEDESSTSGNPPLTPQEPVADPADAPGSNNEPIGGASPTP